MEPIAGIVLGPYAGFVSTFIGVMIGHSIFLRGEAPVYEYLFTLGAPIGTMVCGFMFQRKVKRVFLYFTLLLVLYFLSPIAWELPIWGMWDVYIAYFFLSVLLFMNARRNMHSFEFANNVYVYALCAFIGLEADILFRIFLFIPGQTYHFLYGFSSEIVKIIWTAGALVTPIQVSVGVLLCTFMGPVLVKILSLRGWYLFETEV
jgi:hypothetical protein